MPDQPQWLTELPPSGRGVYDRAPNPRLENLAELLRTRPGVWLRVGVKTSRSSAGSAARSIRNGSYLSFRPAGHYEAVVRGFEVYARYVGKRHRRGGR